MGHLLPGSGSLWSGADQSWVFRGQADATWDLSPSAFRPTSDEEFAKILPATEKASERRERLVVEHFVASLDRAGLEVPGDHVAWRPGGAPVAERSSETEYPRVEWRWMFAIAQHHGIPTRLLDWSFSPLVALYFAALGAARRSAVGQNQSARFAVWALSNDFVEKLPEPAPIRIITVPTASNPNLRAQRGLFTLVAGTEGKKPRTIKQVIEQMETGAKPESWHSGRRALRKITAPARLASKILHRLHLLGIDVSTLFPGHQSVAELLKEKGLHQGE